MQARPILLMASMVLAANSTIVLAKEAFHPIQSHRVKTDRYTLVKTDIQPEQISPLQAISTLALGKDVMTVGDAINEALRGSGYRWAPKEDDHLLNILPLPAIDRFMGPLKIDNMLKTLAGEAWTLRTDNLNRVVWFELKASDSHAK